MKRIHQSDLIKLIKRCPHMHYVYELVGFPPPRIRKTGFPALVRIIVDQQVSTHCGVAIWRNLEENIREITPLAVLEAGEENLRACGFSGSKARYASALARAIIEGRLNISELRKQSNEQVESELTKIKGIGRWTSDIYQMFSLGRSDVWPAGDLAVAVAVQHLLGMTSRPSQGEMDEISQQWRPWRTAAATMLWHYYRYIKSMPVGESGRT